MKIAKSQLRRIINELHPRDVSDAEYDEYLQDLGGMYSDMHKELYRRRPNIPMFKTVEEAEAAVEELWGEYAAKNRAREAQEKADLEFIEMERKTQEMMPGEYDYEHVPRRSGMGRRLENRMKITKGQLRRIIRETLIAEDKSGKGACPDTGCFKQSGDKWRIISNKTGKMWPQKYKTKKSAEAALRGYHASRG